MNYSFCHHQHPKQNYEKRKPLSSKSCTEFTTYVYFIISNIVIKYNIRKTKFNFCIQPKSRYPSRLSG